MPVLRVIILWHQHQPFYKDLVSGEYRLPWVRLHALKDYFGMVKLLDEFPNVHQTFNLVPSLITQIQDYVSGTAQDPFLQVAAKPAKDLTQEERRFALQYLFQANPVNVIGRYPRYRELWEKFRGAGDSPERAEKYFQPQDFTDLQVLSQIGWFDEYFLAESEVAELIRKGRNYTLEDQRFLIARERELLGRVLPVHADAAKKGLIEISTSPFYHPILPLVCDTQVGAVSSPGLALPQYRYRHPEDAREQLLRGLDLHEKVFGVRPQGVWPSEGSVSEEALAIAHRLGVQWMATDEGVLGRSLGINFSRDGNGYLNSDGAQRLYTIHRYENADTRMNLLFRDHTLSDLIGFVYSGMPPQDAANNLIHKIKESAKPILAKGHDAMVPIILDGENAWEYYPRSGREFLRRFYDAFRRKHLSNIYQALAGPPPDYLAQPITGEVARPSFIPQTAYIHPRVSGDMVRYFEWMGAACYTADQRSGAMHGKQFLMDEVFAGIDEQYVYGRLDFAGKVPEGAFEVVVNLESWANHAAKPRRELRLDAVVDGGRIQSWKVTDGKDKAVADSTDPGDMTRVALVRNFEFRLPLTWLLAAPLEIDKVRGAKNSDLLTTRLRLRFSLWQNHLPVDALPVEGWIELELLAEEDLLGVGG